MTADIVKVRQTVRFAPKSVVPMVAAAALVALAGCGAPPTAFTTYPATCPISSATPDPTLAPTMLQAVRPYNAILDLVAFSRCATDATLVRNLYTAAFARPHTTGISPCPKGFDVTYNLTFLHGSDTVQTMTLLADGCRFLYISQKDIRTTDTDFQLQVAELLGLSQLSPREPLVGPQTT